MKKQKKTLFHNIIFLIFISVGASNARAESQISGFVWLDNNGNGLQDFDEPGFAQTVPGFGAPNISFYATGSTILIESLPLDENSNGKYSFDDVPNGSYYVCVSNEFRPLGLTITIRNAGDNGAINSDFDGSCSYNISVSGDQVVKRDLGLVNEPNERIDLGIGNQISGFVWLDNNGNGLQDSNEPGFAQTVPGFGAPNIAFYATGSDVLIDFFSLDENSNGEYSFDDVPDGDYYVCASNEFRPLGLTVATPNAGDNEAIDSDFDGSPCSYNISVSGGQVVMRDLGLVEKSNGTAKISGTVWIDRNGDGIRQNSFPAPEIGIDSIALELFRNGDIEPFKTTVSSAIKFTNLLQLGNLGRFQFENITNGDYLLCAVDNYTARQASVTIQNTGDDNVDNDFDNNGCTELTIETGKDTIVDLGLVAKPGPIIVNDLCTIDAAINAATLGIPSGGCPAGNFAGRDNISLRTGDSYSSIKIPFLPNPNTIDFNGNGAMIKNFTTPGSGTRFTIATINNATIGSANPSGGDLFISNSVVNVLTSVTGDGFVSITNSTVCGTFVESLQYDRFGNNNNPCRR